MWALFSNLFGALGKGFDFFKKSPEQKERDRMAKNIKRSKTNIKEVADAIDKARRGDSSDIESILGL